ncbi:MAG: class I tRNA ligase family protein [Nitrospirales bacterium]|nr:class I tRNA ligase family protein [Nitrospirales bacterium]
MRLFNTLGRRCEVFRPVNGEVVNMFTCGPSVYQKAHIGNFRTFLFEDILVRYLEYAGYAVYRGMNITDVEDKAIREAEMRRVSVRKLADRNIDEFLREMRLLGMKIPDYLPRASDCVEIAVEIIRLLLGRGVAYWHKGNVYYDPLKHPGFGKLYGLDMSKWPKKRVRFHRDTYPGIQWNRGDFILWHGQREKDPNSWNTEIGWGRPAWNIQDPSMILHSFSETLSLYCGGIDNLYRHHDYTLAILESVRPYPMARYWLHCHHLYVNGRKMSKSKGTIYYTDTLLGQGYTAKEIRFSLIYGHYRSKLDYSDEVMSSAAGMLRDFRRTVSLIRERAGRRPPPEGESARQLRRIFEERMNDDLDTKGAFDGMRRYCAGLDIDALKAGEAAGISRVLEETDGVLGVLY